MKFSCKKNLDVERFLKNTAIRFQEADKARTYIITQDEEENEFKILGYFSITTKPIILPNTLSKNKVKALDGFNKNARTLNCFLIGQLAKNDIYKDIISGQTILDYALNVIQSVQKIIGMRVVLIECEDKKQLVDFYTKHNFERIDKDEKTGLLQFITTISNYIN